MLDTSDPAITEITPAATENTTMPETTTPPDASDAPLYPPDPLLSAPPSVREVVGDAAAQIVDLMETLAARIYEATRREIDERVRAAMAGAPLPPAPKAVKAKAAKAKASEGVEMWPEPGQVRRRVPRWLLAAAGHRTEKGARAKLDKKYGAEAVYRKGADGKVTVDGKPL